jgi:SAM-dependent methyltransferase
MELRRLWWRFGELMGRSWFHPQYLLGRQNRSRKLWLSSYLTGRVLDVGSGDFQIAPYGKAVQQYISLDFPTTNLRYRQLPQVFGDAHVLPFSENTFDAVLLLEVIEHVSSPETVVKEATRCLKNGGLLFLSAPFLYPLHDAPNDFQRISPYAIQRLFPSAQWKPVYAQIADNFLYFWVLSLNLHLAHTLERLGERKYWSRFLLLLPVAAFLVFWGNFLAFLLGRVGGGSRFILNYFYLFQKL